MPGTRWTAEERSVLQENYSWNPAVFSMLPGRSYMSVKSMAQSLGLQCAGRGHSRTLRADYFDHWSPNMAWVLGFITADGNVMTGLNTTGVRVWCLTIVQKEEAILKAICDELCLPHSKVITALRTVTLPQGTTGTYMQSRLSFTNKHMVERLIELGVMPAKSLQITKMPVPKKYFAHFLRGYFDGDGCFSWGPNRSPRVSFTSGSPQFLEWLQTSISKYYEMPGGRLRGRRVGRAWDLGYKKNTSMKLMGIMFVGPDAELCLARKKENFLSYLTYHGIDLSAHETPEAKVEYFYNLVKI